MEFWKMNGAGNDFIIINNIKEQLSAEQLSECARILCKRHMSIGADGFMAVDKPSAGVKADYRMRFYNADGMAGEMCGNGIRCVGKYMYDYGLTDKEAISVETLAGIKYLQFFIENGKVAKVKVDMGSPILTPAEIPVVAEGERAVDEPIVVDGTEYRMTCISMGNPHAIVYVDDVKNLPIEKIGPLFEKHERFPNRVNTEFVKVLDRNTVEMRVWERGSGETLACGTGACATAVACILNGLTEEKVTVKLLGGDLEIEWDREKNKVFMTGPAKVVFDGVWEE